MAVRCRHCEQKIARHTTVYGTIWVAVGDQGRNDPRICVGGVTAFVRVEHEPAE
jgi:hypothetical protein